MEKYNYEDRIVAFIDILAFKNFVTKTVDGQNDVEERIAHIVDAYNSIRSNLALEEKPEISKLLLGSKKITIVSDSIIISFLQTETSALYWTIYDLFLIQVNLAIRGILCRGALVHGKMIHNDKFLFGPALVEAYETETKAALYPRIILGAEVLYLAAIASADQHTPEEEVKHIEGFLNRDSDGMYYIDYFNPELVIGMLDSTEEYLRYTKKLVEMVNENQLNNKPEIRIKYLWMKEKVNEMVRFGKDPKIINLLIQEGRESLADSLLDLKEIL